MKFTTQIDKTEEGFDVVIDAAQKFERDRVLEGLDIRKFTIEKVWELTTIVQDAHLKIKGEMSRIVLFSRTFNKKFATDNNKCFETSVRLFNKIRSSLSWTKKFYYKFRQKIRGKAPYGQEQKKLSVFKRSILNGGGFTRSLFGEEGYHDAVKALCDNLESFYSDLILIIMLCKEVLSEEQSILNDPERLNDIYMEDRTSTKKKLQAVLAHVQNLDAIQVNDPMASLMKKLHRADFQKGTFHKYNRSDFSAHVISEEIVSGRADGLDDMESLLWPEDHAKAMQVRLIIEHFDELNPKGIKKQDKYRLDGKVMAMFVMWCGLGNSGKIKPFIEKYFNKKYEGQYLTISANTVTTAKNGFLGVDINVEYAKFEQNVQSILYKYENSEKKANF